MGYVISGNDLLRSSAAAVMGIRKPQGLSKAYLEYPREQLKISVKKHRQSAPLDCFFVAKVTPSILVCHTIHIWVHILLRVNLCSCIAILTLSEPRIERTKMWKSQIFQKAVR